MLRSAAEAEDVVQDVWLRWQETDRTVVRDAVVAIATIDAAADGIEQIFGMMNPDKLRAFAPARSWREAAMRYRTCR